MRAVLRLAVDTPVLSALPAGTRLVRTQRNGDLLELSVTPEPGALPVRRRVLALGQLVLTVTEDAAVRRVRVRSGDTALRLEAPDGSLLVRPLTRDDFAGLTAVSAVMEPSR